MAKMKLQFPNIYRVITERVVKSKKKNPKLLRKIKLQWIVIFYFVTVFLILFLSFDLLISLQKQKEINFEKTKIQSEIKLWEAIAEKYQGYKEAYYQLAVLNFRIGEIDKAKYYVSKALYLDPNFEKARSLQNTLRGY